MEEGGRDGSKRKQGVFKSTPVLCFVTLDQSVCYLNTLNDDDVVTY